ncbi:MAG: CBS domain-containing protein [Candidatus Micrarchaeota archaeon]
MQLSKAITVNANEPVSKAISKIKKYGLGVLVFEGKKYLGIIDERKLREKSMDPAKTFAKSMVIATPIIRIEDSSEDICRSFFAGRFKTLPVMDKNKLIGSIGRWDILSMLDKEGYLKGHKVRNHMSSPIMTVDAYASSSVANTIMREGNVRRLAVLENGRLVGVVSVFDLLPTRMRHESKIPRIKGKGKKSTDLPVYSFMKKEVETISFNSSLSDAVKKMLNKKRAGLIVVEKERPAGIITAKDILEVVVRERMRLPVVVSGLHGTEKSLSEDIAKEGEKLLKKLKKTIGATALSLHIKQTGREYFVSAHIRGRNMLRTSSSEFGLMNAVREAMDELEKQAEKAKITGMSKRRN